MKFIDSSIHFLLLIFYLITTACTSLTSGYKSNPQKKAFQQKTFAIKNVNIIPMTPGGEVLLDATVIIEDGKILSINDSVPKNAEIINGKGKWLIPGLIDAHVHIPTDGRFDATYPTKVSAIFTNTQDVMLPFVANGVTTVFELISKAGHFGQRNEIARGDVIGPRMALAASINGGKGSNMIADTPTDGRQSVRNAKSEGYELIKVYSELNIETYNAVVDEARKQGLKVVGHIPNSFKGKIEKVLFAEFLVAHAEEYAKQTRDYSDQDAKRFARLAKENGTWLSPTLIVMARIAEQTRTLDSIRNLQSLQYVHPLLQSKWLTANKNYIGTSPERVASIDKIVNFNNRLVKAFKEADVPIIAGTDAGSSGVILGYSLHDELELLVKAGLSPKDALVSATLLPATWLGLESKIGTIELGKFADLVLLDANPLDDIKNTRKIFGVFVDGRWLDRSRINYMLSDLSKRNAASKNKYDWSKRGEY